MMTAVISINAYRSDVAGSAPASAQAAPVITDDNWIGMGQAQGVGKANGYGGIV
ncbi:MAG: hypothetical protein JXA18_09760 [Chitinispirillaceae bacterium]|nr:hypothetical protein [Chitinispirillaceae bacterium]